MTQFATASDRAAIVLAIMAARQNGLPSVAVIRALSVRIGADPRSIERELLTPGSVTGIAGHRIRKALRELGVGLGMPPIDPGDLMPSGVAAFSRFGVR